MQQKGCDHADSSQLHDTISVSNVCERPDEEPAQALMIANEDAARSSSTSASSHFAGAAVSCSWELWDGSAHTAMRVHQDLLAELAVAAPSTTAASLGNECVYLYTQYVFGAVPMCHEASLRAAIRQFCILPSRSDDDHRDDVHTSRCFAERDDHELLATLRSFALLAALCELCLTSFLRTSFRIRS